MLAAPDESCATLSCSAVTDRKTATVIQAQSYDSTYRTASSTLRSDEEMRPGGDLRWY